MRGLTIEQKRILDEYRRGYKEQTGNVCNSVDQLHHAIYDKVCHINLFETIYQEINMYLWDKTSKEVKV